MTFTENWTQEAERQFAELRDSSERASESREKKGKRKSSKAEGLFRQTLKCIRLLLEDPHHPGLNTHQYHSLPHPFVPGGKVYEAYIQNKTSGAYRLFWCYGPDTGQITVIAITPHP